MASIPPSRPPSPPIQFPNSGFAVLDPGDKIEEETLPFYKPVRYYPVHIGEVFKSRYQVITKLGYGVNSTVWLCRDLNKHQYLTLKVRVRAKHDHPYIDPEIAVSKHLEACSLKHTGKDLVRTVLDSFDVVGPSGTHKCLIYQPLSWTFATFLDLLPERRFSKDLVQQSAQLILIALDYLHECNVVHTDLTSNNTLMQIVDESIIPKMTEAEIEHPFPRMIRPDRTIYTSRLMPPSPGQPVICDLGEARVGSCKHKGDIMPDIMRAAEVILGMEWDTQVDIWALGLTVWLLLEGHHLFSAKKEGILNDEQHLAEMVSLMGASPPSFLERSEECCKYWDTEGNWKGSLPIPEQSFESREQLLDDRSKALFVQFLRRTLRWLPEERPVAKELAFDEFLMQYQETEIRNSRIMEE